MEVRDPLDHLDEPAALPSRYELGEMVERDAQGMGLLKLVQPGMVQEHVGMEPSVVVLVLRCPGFASSHGIEVKAGSVTQPPSVAARLRMTELFIDSTKSHSPGKLSLLCKIVGR